MMGTTGMCIPYGPCMTGIPPPIIGGGGPPYPPCICCWYIGDSPIVSARSNSALTFIIFIGSAGDPGA